MQKRWPQHSRGLSPRVRGNRRHDRRRRRRRRSIPARAGEPPSAWASARRTGVYPRACGGTNVLGADGIMPLGLSPRVRGNLSMMFDDPSAAGSIPARAGEPAPRRRGRWSARVYPRACGGTNKNILGKNLEFGLSRACGGTGRCRRKGGRSYGLSPRVRGNPSRALGAAAGTGSIPARAGEPIWGFPR